MIISTIQSVATMIGVGLTCTRMELLDRSDVPSTTQQLQGDLESTTLKSDDDHRTSPRERLVPSQSSNLQGDSVKGGLLGAEKERRCSPSSWDWKKLLLITSLWWAYFLINGAHSMIAPFFPNQVYNAWMK